MSGVDALLDVVHIQDLNVTLSDQNWKIPLKVVNQCKIKAFSNQNGDSKVGTIILQDVTGKCKIQLSLWNEDVEKYYDQLSDNKIYYFCNFRVQMVAKYNQGTTPMELRPKQSSSLCVMTQESIDKMFGKNANAFVILPKLDRLENQNPNATFNLIAIVHEVGPIEERVGKTNGRAFKQRVLVVTDSSCYSIHLTLYDADALEYNEAVLKDHPAVLFTNCKVSTFNGMSINATYLTRIYVNSGKFRTKNEELKKWYSEFTAEKQKSDSRMIEIDDSMGSLGPNLSETFNTSNGPVLHALSTRYVPAPKSCFDVPLISIERFLQQQPAAKTYYGLKLLFDMAKHDIQDPSMPYFLSCCNLRPKKLGAPLGESNPMRACSKKVDSKPRDDGSGEFDYFCKTCQRQPERIVAKYSLNVHGLDHSGEIFLNMFDEAAFKCLGVTAERLKDMRTNDIDGYYRVFQNFVNKEYLCLVSIVASFYENKKKYEMTICDVQPFDSMCAAKLNALPALY